VEKTFYQEICEATELSEEREICQRYEKDFRKVRSCINAAMKEDMMSTNTSREVFHSRIVEKLKARGL